MSDFTSRKIEQCAECEEDFEPGELFVLEDRAFGGDFYACEGCVRDMGRWHEVGLTS